MDVNYYESELAARFAGVSLPNDAIENDAWRRHGAEDWRRHFLSKEWNVAGIWVSVAGEQNHHGGIRRWMHVGGEDQCTTSDRRQLVIAIEEAGRLLDALVGGSGPGEWFGPGPGAGGNGTSRR